MMRTASGSTRYTKTRRRSRPIWNPHTCASFATPPRTGVLRDCRGQVAAVQISGPRTATGSDTPKPERLGLYELEHVDSPKKGDNSGAHTAGNAAQHSCRATGRV